jgi:thiamine kinase-like enzyme
VIDWDFASPGPRLWDLAYLAYRVVPLTTADWGDGFGPGARRGRSAHLLQQYGSDAQPRELIRLLVQRLEDLAQVSDEAAVRLDILELRDHASLYRHDAAHLAVH